MAEEVRDSIHIPMDDGSTLTMRGPRSTIQGMQDQDLLGVANRYLENVRAGKDPYQGLPIGWEFPTPSRREKGAFYEWSEKTTARGAEKLEALGLPARAAEDVATFLAPQEPAEAALYAVGLVSPLARAAKAVTAGTRLSTLGAALQSLKGQAIARPLVAGGVGAGAEMVAGTPPGEAIKKAIPQTALVAAGETLTQPLLAVSRGYQRTARMTKESDALINLVAENAEQDLGVPVGTIPRNTKDFLEFNSWSVGGKKRFSKLFETAEDAMKLAAGGGGIPLNIPTLNRHIPPQPTGLVNTAGTPIMRPGYTVYPTLDESIMAVKDRKSDARLALKKAEKAEERQQARLYIERAKALEEEFYVALDGAVSPSDPARVGYNRAKTTFRKGLRFMDITSSDVFQSTRKGVAIEQPLLVDALVKMVREGDIDPRDFPNLISAASRYGPLYGADQVLGVPPFGLSVRGAGPVRREQFSRGLFDVTRQVGRQLRRPAMGTGHELTPTIMDMGALLGHKQMQQPDQPIGGQP